MFEVRTFSSELFRDAGDDRSDEAVRLFHRCARLIDKTDLGLIPTSAKLIEFGVGK